MLKKNFWVLALLPGLTLFCLPGCGNQSKEAVKPEQFAPPPPGDTPAAGGGGVEKAEG